MQSLAPALSPDNSNNPRQPPWLLRSSERGFDMAHWLTCVLTGRHAYSPWCADGAIFLRCTNCGRRSPGWQVAPTRTTHARPDTAAREHRRAVHAVPRLSIVSSE